jgi:uncharacterized membrane protein
MAKRKNQLSQRDREITFSQEHDDSFFPPAEELAKLHEIDPEITRFIRESATREQAHRHKMQKDGMTLSKREQRLSYGLNYCGVIGFLMLCGYLLYLAYQLIMNDKDTLGSLFAVGTISAIGIVLFRFFKNNK